MSRIPGYLRSVTIPGVAARPYVDVELLIDGASGGFDVRFLIDTGADDTILHPRDTQRPDAPPLPFSFDDHPERRRVGGIGGSTDLIPVSARLFFQTDTGGGRLWQDCRVWVAQPNDTNQRLPSLLGRDLLQFFRLTVDYDATPPVLLEQS